MGLNIHAANHLIAEKNRGISFGRTLTLGKQTLYIDPILDRKFFLRNGLRPTVTGGADAFLASLGADPLLSTDFSAYEGADIIHDFNSPIPDDLHGTFDTVFDGGSLEHIFNFPTAIGNCMNLTKCGGQLIIHSPWHNYPGHGFFEFSPELWWRTLSPENGFQIERMLLVANGSWYQVKDPMEMKRRIEIQSTDKINLHLTARKLTDVTPFQSWPQQSDYSSAWASGESIDTEVDKLALLKRKWAARLRVLALAQQAWRNRKHARHLNPAHNAGLRRICAEKDLPISV